MIDWVKNVHVEFIREFRVDLQRRSLFDGGLVQTLLNMAKNYCFGFSADMYNYSAMSQGFREILSSSPRRVFLLLLRIGGQTAASLCRRIRCLASLTQERKINFIFLITELVLPEEHYLELSSRFLIDLASILAGSASNSVGLAKFQS
ncbi:hypothetical protein CFP56_011673, partial [Quercus suber]